MPAAVIIFSIIASNDDNLSYIPDMSSDFYTCLENSFSFLPASIRYCSV